MNQLCRRTLHACVHANGGHSEHVVTINLFSLHSMYFMFHTMLDAASNILRLQYKSMKCDDSFSQGSISMLYIFHVIFFLLMAVQNICKTNEFFKSYEHKCTATFFMKHNVYITRFTAATHVGIVTSFMRTVVVFCKHTNHTHDKCPFVHSINIKTYRPINTNVTHVAPRVASQHWRKRPTLTLERG